MMPKSLPHQTLAKLISETDRLFLFSFFINSTEPIIVETQNSVKHLFSGLGEWIRTTVLFLPREAV